MRKKVGCFLFYLTWMSIHANAQSYFTLGTVNYAFATKNYFSGKPVYQSESANLNIPIKLKNENKILTGLLFQKINLKFDSSGKKDLYNTGINLGFVKKTEKGSLLLMLVSRINSDFTVITSKSYQFGGVLLVTRKQNEKFTLKYGLYYNTELFGPFIVPLLGLDWRLNEKWRIFGIMPQNLTIENKITPVFRWGLAYFSPTNSYHLSNSIPNLYLQQNQTRVGLFSDLYLTKKIVATAKVEYPIIANYRIFNSGQKFDANIWGIGIGGNRADNNTPIENLKHSLIFQLGFSYRVELE